MCTMNFDPGLSSVHSVRLCVEMQDIVMSWRTLTQCPGYAISLYVKHNVGRNGQISLIGTAQSSLCFGITQFCFITCFPGSPPKSLIEYCTKRTFFNQCIFSNIKSKHTYCILPEPSIRYRDYLVILNRIPCH